MLIYHWRDNLDR